MSEDSQADAIADSMPSVPDVVEGNPASTTPPEDTTIQNESEADINAEDKEEVSESEENAEVNIDETKDEKSDESEGDTETPDPKEEARQRYAERQRLKQAVSNLVDSQYKLPTPMEIMESQEEVDEAVARSIALEQKVQMMEFKNQVTELNQSLYADANAVQKDINVFNPKSPEYDEDFAQKTLERYERYARVQYDPSGQYVINAEIPLYEFFSEQAELRSSGMKKGQIDGRRAAEKQMSAVEPQSSHTETVTAEEDDPFIQGMNRVK